MTYISKKRIELNDNYYCKLNFTHLPPKEKEQASEPVLSSDKQKSVSGNTKTDSTNKSSVTEKPANESKPTDTNDTKPSGESKTEEKISGETENDNTGTNPSSKTEEEKPNKNSNPDTTEGYGGLYIPDPLF